MEKNNIIGNINSVDADGQLGIQSENSPFIASFYFSDFYDEKAIKKFIKSVERLIRTSKEYKTYIESLRTGVQALNRDSLLGNITSADTDLEFHHYPITLYEIVEVVMLSHFLNNQKFTSFSLAKEVMELHNKHVIGLVSLTETTHELAHSGNIFLNKKQVFGDYKKFMNMYSNGISIDLRNKILEMEKYSNMNVPSNFKGLL